LPSVDLQYAVGRFDWNTSRGFDDKQNQQMRLESKGRIAGISYGFSHTRVGEEFRGFEKSQEIKNKGKGVSEVWLSQTLGKLSLQPFVKHSRNNIERDPRKPVLKDELAGVTLDYTWSSWPYVGTSVTYATGTRASASEPLSYSPFKTGITTLSAGATLSLDTWNLYASFDRATPEASKSQSHNQPVTSTYYAGASFYPNSSLTITPSVYLSDEVYDAMDARTRTLGSYLSASLKPWGRDYELMAFASYDASSNADWGLDSEYFYSEFGMQWNVDRRNAARQTLSLALAYDEYRDGFVRDADTSSFSVRLTFRSVAPFRAFPEMTGSWARWLSK
jgi:hypothetical protein